METTQVCYDAAWLKRLLKAILIFSVWLVPYYQLVEHTRWVWPLMALAFFGLLLGTTWVIRYGEKGAQTRFINGTGLILGPGIHFMWNLCPPFRQIGMTLGLGVQIIEDRYPEVYSRDGEHHHLDTRDVHVSTVISNLFSLGIYNLTRIAISFLFDFKDDSGRFMYYKIGRLLFLTALLLGNIASFFPKTEEVPGFWQKLTSTTRENPKFPLTSSRAGSTLVYSRLQEGMAPKMPLPENFVPRPASTTQLFFNVDSDVDTRKYYLFHEPPLGKVHTIRVNESLCAVIPAGRETLFLTKTRPRFEVNTEDAVGYVVKKGEEDVLHTIYKKIKGTTSHVDTMTWKKIYSNWSKVDVDNYGIIVYALPENELPEPGKGHGALVCF